MLRSADKIGCFGVAAHVDTVRSDLEDSIPTRRTLGYNFYTLTECDGTASKKPPSSAMGKAQTRQQTDRLLGGTHGRQYCTISLEG